MAVIDDYFSCASPWSWLGHERLVALAGRHGASVNVKPVDYRRVFPATGGVPLKARAAQRQAYRLVELPRWRDWASRSIRSRDISRWTPIRRHGW